MSLGYTRSHWKVTDSLPVMKHNRELSRFNNALWIGALLKASNGYLKTLGFVYQPSLRAYSRLGFFS